MTDEPGHMSLSDLLAYSPPLVDVRPERSVRGGLFRRGRTAAVQHAGMLEARSAPHPVLRTPMLRALALSDRPQTDDMTL